MSTNPNPRRWGEIGTGLALSLLAVGILLGGLGVGHSVAASTAYGSLALDTAGTSGAVFLLSNALHGNQLLVYERAPSGALTRVGAFATHGLGTGANLGDAGALALTSNRNFLIGVNAGSNTVSVFRFNGIDASPPVSFTDQFGSAGLLPVSVTTFHHWVYVVNAGNAAVPATIAGFLLHRDGTLSSLAGSNRVLPGGLNPAPAQISFNPAGTILVVTEKATNRIVSFPVAANGSAGPAKSVGAMGIEPFGFTFAPNGVLFVTVAGTSALASFSVSPTGVLHLITAPLTDHEKAACWVSTTGNGGFALVSNTASNTISTYSLRPDGTLALLHRVAASTAAGPADNALVADGTVLFVHAATGTEIQAFAVHANGSLTPVQSVSGLPPAAEGLVAF